MQYRKPLIWIGLVVWIVGVFVGRWGLVASSGDDYVVEQKSDADGGSIDKGGWMAFGLAVQEICIECTGTAGRERLNGGENDFCDGCYVRAKRELKKRSLRCKTIDRIISEKRLIRYYVFGLCKMLD